MDIDERIANLVAATARGTAIEQELMRTEILGIGTHLTSNVGSSAPPVVILETRRSAFFKRFRDQDANICAQYRQDPLDVPLHEVAAWRLAYAMGNTWRQLLPTAVFRKIEGLGGALISAKSGRVDFNVMQDAPAQVTAAAFFDALIGNQDRNARNFRYSAKDKRLGLIDHGFAFARPGDPANQSFFLARRRMLHMDGLTGQERSAIEALLESGDLHGLRGFLPADRAGALEARADHMLTSGRVPLPSAF